MRMCTKNLLIPAIQKNKSDDEILAEREKAIKSADKLKGAMG